MKDDERIRHDEHESSSVFSDFIIRDERLSANALLYFYILSRVIIYSFGVFFFVQ